ncbi:hypothetical protein MLC35_03405 [Sulfurimonas sp. NW7]|uniref:hypothetical protein n=1 Tax=Sulfurimonas sp. NW7 TaxID=2922727 RepID=UPI003DA875CB
MSNKIFIITVFIGNIAFGGVLPKIDLQGTIHTKSTNSFRAKVSKKLFEHGLDKKIAKANVDNVLLHDDALNELMTQNILKNIPLLKDEDILNFITHSALRKKTVDLSSYATLVSLVQKHAAAFIDKELISQIEQTSIENEKLKSMKVFV